MRTLLLLTLLIMSPVAYTDNYYNGYDDGYYDSNDREYYQNRQQQQSNNNMRDFRDQANDPNVTRIFERNGGSTSTHSDGGDYNFSH